MVFNTLCELVRHSVGRFADRVAFSMFEGDDVTYAEVGQRIEKVQRTLTEAGLSAGDKVALLSSSMPNWADTAVRLYPETFNCKATVETQTLHRSIYEAEVFNARVAISGSFNTDKVAADSMYVRLTVNPGQIVKLSPLTIGGKSINWEQSDSYIYAKIDSTAQPDTLEFATDFDIHGS